MAGADVTREFYHPPCRLPQFGAMREKGQGARLDDLRQRRRPTNLTRPVETIIPDESRENATTTQEAPSQLPSQKSPREKPHSRAGIEERGTFPSSEREKYYPFFSVLVSFSEKSVNRLLVTNEKDSLCFGPADAGNPSHLKERRRLGNHSTIHERVDGI